MNNSNAYSQVTERITKLMEQGQIPWVKPWSGSSKLGEAKNLISLKPYRGINAFLTAGFEKPYFMTYKQAQSIGANVKAGEKGTPIVFWGSFEKETDDDEKPEKGMFLKTYTVFNVSQIENICPKLQKLIDESLNPIVLSPIEQSEQAERIIEQTKADIRFEEQRAYYSPKLDYINLPKRDSFTASAEFYSTAFHELGHWTGHESRLDRKDLTESAYFGSHTYSNEELCAELCAAFVCSSLGITTESSIRNSAAYLQGWLKRLKNDPKLFVYAAQRAQKAADLILKKETK